MAAYGTALGTAMSSYYESLNENAVDAAYSGWIVGAPVVCMICNILLGKVITYIWLNFDTVWMVILFIIQIIYYL